ncbi:unnamed protein product [Larinioides sclopetarius]|uniref:Uncharacterized protein n=1 Tax=Larinioides sclopetarius TaxID=280406 RepID=A0AAV2AHT7_9ARAC
MPGNMWLRAKKPNSNTIAKRSCITVARGTPVESRGIRIDVTFHRKIKLSRILRPEEVGPMGIGGACRKTDAQAEAPIRGQRSTHQIWFLSHIWGETSARRALEKHSLC